MIARPSFLSMFVKSPFKRLEEHMKIVQTSVRLLSPFFTACISQDWQKAQSLYEEISTFESHADGLKRKIRIKLHHDLYLPVSRSELLMLLEVQDRMANQAEDIALLMYSRKMVLPAGLDIAVQTLLGKALLTAEKANEVSSELSDLVETGFKGLTLRSAKALINDLYALENASDVLQQEARGILFEQEHQHPVLDVVFWYKCIEKIGHLADWSRRVGTQLLLLSSR